MHTFFLFGELIVRRLDFCFLIKLKSSYPTVEHGQAFSRVPVGNDIFNDQPRGRRIPAWFQWGGRDNSPQMSVHLCPEPANSPSDGKRVFVVVINVENLEMGRGKLRLLGGPSVVKQPPDSKNGKAFGMAVTE